MIRRGQRVARETRAWDSLAGVTKSLRLKEGEEEYGYIFEPDLPNVTLAKEKIAAIKSQLPELASQKVSRYVNMGIAKELALAITSEPSLARMFEQVAEKADKQLAAKWFAGEVQKTLNYNNLRMKDTGLKPGHLIRLFELLESRKVTERTAEIMLRDMVMDPKDPLIAGQSRLFDEKTLEPVVKEVLDQNAQAIIDYKSGKAEVFNFLVGQAMKKTEGRGDPDIIRRLLKEKIG
jgi:aspartyl-tRNA(Asn)/glutamyl-tRNA(Gln) amidotransferase subunit B